MVYATGNIIVRSHQARDIRWVTHAVAYTGDCLLQVEGEEHEQKYSHIFHLLPEGGSYWVQVRCTTSLRHSF